MSLGAIFEGGQTRFRVWAPLVQKLELEVQGSLRPLRRVNDGHWEGAFEVGPGTRYFYVLDGERRRPDPASRSQPEGVHGPSEIIDARAFSWQHTSGARSLSEYVIYELHMGTFTPEGTFD